MPRLNVSPTRMELTRLREQLTIAKRGHKMLKDKQDALSRDFMELCHRARNIRKEVESDLARADNSLTLSAAATGQDALLMNLSYQRGAARVHVKSRRVLSLRVPDFEPEGGDAAPPLHPYSFLSTPGDTDDASVRLHRLFPKLVKLAELEKACQMLSEEIKATRRRVNALEFRTIVDIEETISYILMCIDERERSHIARLMQLTDE